MRKAGERETERERYHTEKRKAGNEFKKEDREERNKADRERKKEGMEPITKKGETPSCLSITLSCTVTPTYYEIIEMNQEK